MFTAELRKDVAIDIDEMLDVALRVEKATFEWEESVAHEALGGKKGKKGERKEQGKASRKVSVEEVDREKKTDAAPFRIRDIDLIIPRGQLTAIVGPVGSGKVDTNAS